MTNYIDAIPCNPQVINSLLPSIPDTPIVSKPITWPSRQSHVMHQKAESSTLKTVSKPDDSSNLGVDQGPSLNPRYMATLDWVEA